MAVAQPGRAFTCEVKSAWVQIPSATPTGSSSVAERTAWDREAEISKFSSLTYELQEKKNDPESSNGRTHGFDP